MKASIEPRIFLSHHSGDKDAVNKLAERLRDADIDVWLDDLEIKVGEEILEKIQDGISKCSHLAVWLTEKSIESGWVSAEWQKKMFEEVSGRKIAVLPLLAEDCEIPYFLKSKKYADFRAGFDHGLEQVIAAVRGSRRPSKEKKWVFSYTKDLLDDLSGESIAIPMTGRVLIIDTLKKLPRSGKKVRLENFRPRLPIRSIYDHLVSVAHTADCLLPIIDHGIRLEERHEIARCIAYHELNEVLLGDIPSYTQLNEEKREDAKVFAERRLRRFTSENRERITNEFLMLFLSEPHQKSLQDAFDIIHNKDNPIGRFFNILDKIDPIIAIWRYLHLHRKRIAGKHEEFLRRLKNFFEYTAPKEIARDNSRDSRLYDMVVTLQDRELAEEYFVDRNVVRRRIEFLPMHSDVIFTIIEDIPFHYAASSENEGE